MMRKPPTGEPYARKPHVRFGGRGGTAPSLPLCATVSLSSLHSERSVSCEITVHVAEGNCIRTRGLLYRVPRRGGEQLERERAACSKANPFRRGVAASLQRYGEAWNRKEPIVRTGVIRKRDVQLRNVFGGWMLGRQDRWTGEAFRTGEVREDSEPS